MKVDFYATLRQIVGKKRVDFSYRDGITVRELLGEVISQYPQLEPEMLDEHGELYRHVHVFINGRDTPYLENGADTPLKEDDTVSMFPAVGGG
jgi:molybdopterin synthase sulfur carrier subunit